MLKIRANLPPRSALTSGHHKSQFTFVFSFMFSSADICSIREISPGNHARYVLPQAGEFQLFCGLGWGHVLTIATAAEMRHKTVLLNTNSSFIIHEKAQLRVFAHYQCLDTCFSIVLSFLVER